MNKLKIATQKLKGKAKQVRGRIEQKLGYPVKGVIDKVKGKIEEKIGDAKLEVGREAEDTKAKGEK